MKDDSDRIAKVVLLINKTVTNLTTGYLEDKIESVKEKSDYRRGLLDGGVITQKSTIRRLEEIKLILES